MAKKEIRPLAEADLMLGMGVNEVARKYNLSAGIVSKWRKALGAEKHAEIQQYTGYNAAQRLVDHFEKQIAALDAIAEHALDKKWLSRQMADNVAALYGVISDKNWRMADAMNKAAERARERAEAEERDAAD